VGWRAAAVWAVLFAVYAATIGLHAFGRSDYAGDEPHYLLTAKSLVDDGDVDLVNQYRAGAYRSYYPYALDPHGALTGGRLNEPHGLGFPALIAPAYAVGGARAVEVLLAAIAALAVALAYRLAVRVVPDPWAIGAALAVGLSPPLVAYSTAVYPELTAGAALAGAALFALRLAERPGRLAALGCFGLVGGLPWMGLRFMPAGLVVAGYAYLALRRARRGLLALLGVEAVAFATAVFVGVNGRLYGGPSPDSAAAPGSGGTGAELPVGYAQRAYRLVALWIDREFGLVRWAPVLLLAFLGAWLLLRERRGGLARAIPTRRGEQSAATLCALACGAQLLVAAFVMPTMFGFWFPGRYLVAALPLAVPLVGLGLRRVPRFGTALALVGAGASVWLYSCVRWSDGGLVVGRPRAPFGPLTDALPLFREGAVAPFVVAGLVGLAVTAAGLAAAWPRSARRPAE
jgi:hypothetical protein